MRIRRWLAILMLAALLSGAASPALALNAGDLLRVSTDARWVALRGGAGAKTERLAKLPDGALVVYGGATVNGFRLVLAGGRAGYVAKGCLRKHSRALKTGRAVWLREKAGGKGRKLLRLRKGALVIAVSDAGGGWFRVACEGLNGYLKSADLRPAFPKDGKGVHPYMNDGRAVAMRKKPGAGASRVTNIPSGARVVCFGLVNHVPWLYVFYKGKYGFIRPDGYAFD